MWLVVVPYFIYINMFAGWKWKPRIRLILDYVFFIFDTWTWNHYTLTWNHVCHESLWITNLHMIIKISNFEKYGRWKYKTLKIKRNYIRICYLVTWVKSLNNTWTGTRRQPVIYSYYFSIQTLTFTVWSQDQNWNSDGFSKVPVPVWIFNTLSCYQWIILYTYRWIDENYSKYLYLNSIIIKGFCTA